MLGLVNLHLHQHHSWLLLITATIISALVLTSNGRPLHGSGAAGEVQARDDSAESTEPSVEENGAGDSRISSSDNQNAAGSRSADGASPTGGAGSASTQEGEDDSASESSRDGASVLGAGAGQLRAHQSVVANTPPTLLRFNPPVTMPPRLVTTKSFRESVTRTLHTEFQDEPPSAEVDLGVIFPGKGDIPLPDSHVTPRQNY